MDFNEFSSHIASSYLRTYVLGWPIYDTYVSEFLRMYPVLRTVTYDVPCFLNSTILGSKMNFIFQLPFYELSQSSAAGSVEGHYTQYTSLRYTLPKLMVCY